MPSLATFKIKGIDALSKRFKKRKLKLDQKRAVNKRILVFLDGWIQRNFRQEGRLSDSKGWIPLAESTKARRRKGKSKKGIAREPKILQDTGTLRSKWDHHYSNKQVRLTSGVPYAVYHDSDKKPRKRLPQRKILPREKDVGKKIREIYGGWVRTNLK